MPSRGFWRSLRFRRHLRVHRLAARRWSGQKIRTGGHTAYTVLGPDGAVKGRNWSARFADGQTVKATGEKDEPVQVNNQ